MLLCLILEVVDLNVLPYVEGYLHFRKKRKKKLKLELVLKQDSKLKKENKWAPRVRPHLFIYSLLVFVGENLPTYIGPYL